jgi:hypothetical protein
MPMPSAPLKPAARIFFAGAAAAIFGWGAGCSVPPEQEGFASQSPQARARAVGTAVAAEDREAIPNLITMLGSDDPAHRMLAIRALEQMTGQTLGYVHTDPEPLREEAIAAWVQWWAEAGDQAPEAGSVAPAAAMADHHGAGAANGPSSGTRPADQER